VLPSSRTVSKVNMALIDFRRVNRAGPSVRQQLLDLAGALTGTQRSREEPVVAAGHGCS
jgi:hypothetical protein